MESTAPLTEAAVRAALSWILYPGLNLDIVSFWMVCSVSVREGRVHVSPTLPSNWRGTSVADEAVTAARAGLR